MRLGWLAVVSTAGCGVLSGLDGLTIADGGVDAASDASIDVGACESGACGAPAGFQPVLFASDRATLCPGASTTLDAVVDPTAPPNACACECTYQPSCLPQTNTFNYGINACDVQGTIAGQLDGTCNTVTPLGQGTFHIQMGPFAPANACTNVPKAAANATAPPGRMCTVTDCSVCASIPGFALCYAQAGDVACPGKLTKHSVGSAANLACGACTACSSTAKCKGTLKMFFDKQCGSSAGSLTVDGTCQGFADGNINSVEYNPSLDPGICTPGTSSPSVSLTAQMTVCCP